MPNRYDKNRAHLAIYNWDKAETVKVKAEPFLKAGDAYRLMDPKDFFGEPVAKGRCEGATIRVPIKGEFGAFVILKGD